MQYNLWDSCPKPALDSRWIDDPFMISYLLNHSELDYLVPTLTLESFPQSARARLAALVSWNKSGQRGVRLKFIRAGIRRRLQVPINPRRAYCNHPDMWPAQNNQMGNYSKRFWSIFACTWGLTPVSQPCSSAARNVVRGEPDLLQSICLEMCLASISGRRESRRRALRRTPGS